MQKKIFSLIISLTFILSFFTPFRAFAAVQEELAAFDYTAPAGTSPESKLTNGDNNSGYEASSGVMVSSAKLFASVDGKTYRKLEW